MQMAFKEGRVEGRWYLEDDMGSRGLFPWFKVGKCGACSVAGGKEPAVREG